MTDLDSTEIISADDSVLGNTSTFDSEASLKILSGTELNTFQINKETIIGRSSPSDLIIPASSLSKQHAKITFNNGQYFITDLGSSNKTSQNKVQLQPHVCYALHQGDEIKFGDVICSFQEQEHGKKHAVSESKMAVIPSTQAITDSYDEQEVTPKVKVWNGNGNDVKQTTPKSNGAKESMNKSSSSLMPAPAATVDNNDDDDDTSLIIGSTSLPTSVPMVVEANNDAPSVQPHNATSHDAASATKSVSTNDISVNQSEVTPADTASMDTAATDDLPSTNTKSAICTDDFPDQMDNSSPRPASEQLETVPVSKLVEQLEDVENIADDTAAKEQVEVTINQQLVKEAIASEQMDTDQGTDSPSMVIDDKTDSTSAIDDPIEKSDRIDDEVVSVPATEVMATEEEEKVTKEVPLIAMEQEAAPEPEKPAARPSRRAANKKEPAKPVTPEKVSTPLVEVKADEPQDENEEAEEQGEEGEEGEEETEAPTSGRAKRGVARKNVRRARGRRGAAARARVVSTRLHGTRRLPAAAAAPPAVDKEENNTTLEETISTEPEESPKKSIAKPKVEEKPSSQKESVTRSQERSNETTAVPAPADSGSNVRVSARIKERTSTGRNRQFPYADDYVDLDDLEKKSKVTNAKPTPDRKPSRARASASPQKPVSLRQQPIDALKSSDQKDKTNVYEQMDTVADNHALTPTTSGRKRKTTTPVAAVLTKRSRPGTPQTAPTMNTRRKPTSTVEESPAPSPTVAKSSRRTIAAPQTTAPATTTTTAVTPKRARKSAAPVEPSPEKETAALDRPVRIALSSHLNFNQTHLDTLRKLGFEIMDESCKVDALVVDRIRRTKKFFMCLARGAHILSPAWIDTMVKENRYIPYDKYYLEDTTAETRYGFQLRESVRLAKQGPMFENRRFFCTKDTSPPYDDLKDIIEAAGGKFIDKINMSKPGKDLICIVGQIHKSEFEDLSKKGVPIVSEEFVLSGISKQKPDFDSFSLFQNATPVKPTGSK